VGAVFGTFTRVTDPHEHGTPLGLGGNPLPERIEAPTSGASLRKMISPLDMLDCLVEFQQAARQATRYEDAVAEIRRLWSRLGDWRVGRKPLKVGRLYRVRGGGVMMKTEADCWAAPPSAPGAPEALPPVNRCNAPGQSVLYAAESEATALQEARLRGNERFYVITYESGHNPVTLRLANVAAPATNKHLQFPGWESRTIAGCSESLPPSIEELSEAKWVQTYDERSFISHRILSDFLRAEFTRPNDSSSTAIAYWLSAALANEFYGDEDTDGIMYPSVQSPGKMCVAIHDQVARNNLRITNIRYGLFINGEAESLLAPDTPKEKVGSPTGRGFVRFTYQGRVQPNGDIQWVSCEGSASRVRPPLSARP